MTAKDWEDVVTGVLFMLVVWVAIAKKWVHEEPSLFIANMMVIGVMLAIPGNMLLCLYIAMDHGRLVALGIGVGIYLLAGIVFYFIINVQAAMLPEEG